MNTKSQILIVEDVKEIVELLRLYLEGENDMMIHEANDGFSAQKMLESQKFDLIILDLMLPGISGYQILKDVRNDSNIPIIIVSSKILDAEKILGLKLGADDYITKPFNPLEVNARVRAQLRRYQILGSKTKDFSSITIDHLVLNIDQCQLRKYNRNIELTYTEYKLLKILMSSPNFVFTQRQLYSYVWEDDFIDSSNGVIVYISKLREKIEDDPKKPKYIKTIRGLGYKFNVE